MCTGNRSFTDGLKPPREEKPARKVTEPKAARKKALDVHENMEKLRVARENALLLG